MRTYWESSVERMSALDRSNIRRGFPLQPQGVDRGDPSQRKTQHEHETRHVKHRGSLTSDMSISSSASKWYLPKRCDGGAASPTPTL